MPLLNPSKGWSSSTSRLLALYSFLFVAWSSILMGVLYFEVSSYLNKLTRHSMLQRQHLFAHMSGKQLDDALIASQAFEERSFDAYGLFDAQLNPLGGSVRALPPELALDGKIHELKRCLNADDPNMPRHSCDAVAIKVQDGRWLVLFRDNGSLFVVTRIILDALLWGISLTLIPGFAGWYLLRRRPLKRIRAVQAQAELIVAGDLTHRLPLSARRDELDMLAAIVNAMLDRIERLMHEVKGVCDNIAHDLRTPLTRLRAQLYRIRQQSDADTAQAEALDQAIGETDTLMARFRGLLRISELEDRQRRAGFTQLDPYDLLVELHDFYLPLAEDGGIQLTLHQPGQLAALHGDRELLFEALANLVGNAIKFTPEGGQVQIAASQDDTGVHLAVEDTGPGIAEQERTAVLKRFYRSDEGHRHAGFGLGLSIVAAIVDLHGFGLEIGESRLGGAKLVLHCPLAGLVK
ncbi:HAMP domain-containing histidine kinase [Pseudomonas fulva]|uniref:sensor histidine kinase n=1 Tax=Pseudomonas TaxID=286 RepID=UPI0006724EC3|nr:MULTISPECIES: HAMP domain-containing sensor histidine kinase [Pseudomonas]MBA1223494.1 HAMP domain-containing histidine kinase [Pseudomonas fulva]MBN4168265.1 HAMP domain-containing histidine kinase [Pseudomonas fulva]MDH1309020.1 HAMP domain-containing histidine kinase [Pseudomonas fulva]TCT85422.1 signal transduction histidine kinase [Pseudomonas sp. LP_4_YM]SNB83473.1 Signal transduction histidine kinase [Pseudomonas sp. LAIL14HWK12:I4]